MTENNNLKLINGKKLADDLLEELKNNTSDIIKLTNDKPTLVVILIGDNKASEIYINKKRIACEKVGIEFNLLKYASNEINELALIELIKELNNDNRINSYIIQLPLPEHININNVIKYYDPNKDVDCFHPKNIGLLPTNTLNTFEPPTPGGILHIINKYNIPTQGKIISIIGKSMIVGTPLALMLSNESKYGATVILCDKWTSINNNLENIVKMSDILIVCAGVKHLINNPEWIKPDSVLIDVGIHRIQYTLPDGQIKYKIVGDIDTDLINTSKLKYLSPSPGGCGSLTVAYLCYNIFKSYIMTEVKLLDYHDKIIKKLNLN